MENPIRADLLGYLKRHAEKMEGEGWHLTARVLEEAHIEITRLRSELSKLAPALTEAR